MKLRYWLCKKCVKPIPVKVVRKSSFVETPMGRCPKCKRAWEVPSALYTEANSALSKKWSQLSQPERDNFEKQMKRADKITKTATEKDWENQKEFFLAMLLCERTVKSDESIAKLLGV